MKQADHRKEQIHEETNLNFHPYNIIMSLTIIGISVLFVAITVAYIYNRIQFSNLRPIHVPYIFLFNTLILLASSYMLLRAKRHYQEDNTPAYQNSLLITFILTFSFLIMQCVGWYLLFKDNIGFAHSNLASYLYVLSGLHFLHVIAGLPFLFIFYRTAIIKMKEPVSVLIYFSDPYKRLKLKLLTLYWHFLDILWIYLVLFLWLNERLV